MVKFIPDSPAEEPQPFRKQLSLLSDTKLMLSMGISFFWIAGYAVFYTFVTPFIQNVSLIDKQLLSGTLFAFGMATLVGNKLGAYLGQKFGVINTILGCLVLNMISLFLLSTQSGTPFLSIATLIIWSLAVWAPGSLLRYNVFILTDKHQGMVMSLYNSLVQFGVAAGGLIGSLALTHWTIESTTYFSIGATLLSLILAVVFSLIGKKHILSKSQA